MRVQRDTRELCPCPELGGEEPAPVQKPRRISLHSRLQADVSSLSQHSEVAGRVVSHVYCGTESFLKETENKQQQHFRSLSCLSHKGLGLGLSLSIQCELFCQRALMSWGSVCSLLQRCSLQTTLPAKTRTHTPAQHQPQTTQQSHPAAPKIQLASLARLEEECRFCMDLDMPRNAHLFLPAAVLLLWSTNSA